MNRQPGDEILDIGYCVLGAAFALGLIGLAVLAHHYASMAL